MDQISGQFHEKIHDLETTLLDTDDLLWEINHKAYQDDPKIMNKIKDDLKKNFSGVKKKVVDLSKLMKNYIDSDVITENVAVKFMKYMSKKQGKKKRNSHDISLTEVLDFLNDQSKLRKLKENEKQVFKNAEMLNSFLLNKHFQFDSDDSAAELYKDSQNSFEKTVKNAIGLSNFISSFGQIITSKLLNNEELTQIKATPRKTKEVSAKKNKSISFELYQIPSKNQTGIVNGNPENSSEMDNRNLKTTLSQKQIGMDSQIYKPKKKRANKKDVEDVEKMPSLQELVEKRKKQIDKDKKRFSHKKISYKITDEERQQKQTTMKVESQSPIELEDVDKRGHTKKQFNKSPLNVEMKTTLNKSPVHAASQNEDSQTGDSLKEDQTEGDEDSQATQSEGDLDPDHFSIEGEGAELSKTSEDVSGETQSISSDLQKSQPSSHTTENLEIEKNLHIDKPTHILDSEEGVYDEDDPIHVQNLDKEEARLKKLETLGYPKVEQIDLEAERPTNSYGIKNMTLTSSSSKFEGNAVAKNAYHELNKIFSSPVQEVKDQYQQTKEGGIEADPVEVETVDPQTHMNTAGNTLDENRLKKSRKLKLDSGTQFSQYQQNYLNQMRMRQERRLRQIQRVPFTPLKQNYSDKDMYRKKSFLPVNKLNRVSAGPPIPRNLRQNVIHSRHVRRKNLKEKTDELYANMLKMRF